MSPISKRISTDHYVMDIVSDPHNKRIRVEDIQGHVSFAIDKTEEIAQKEKAEKIIVKARKEQYNVLIKKGFQCEAMIDAFYLGSDCYFFCKYYSVERRTSNVFLEEDEILRKVETLQQLPSSPTPPSDYQLLLMNRNNCEKLAQLYQKVFRVYPTPMHDANYIKKTLENGSIYYAFVYGDEVVSAASADIDSHYRNAELTDCATLNEHRKYGLMKILLMKLEEELLARRVYCSYSIARSLSYGMNAALHQMGYTYRGRLMNNCYIYDKCEDMNVWVKDLTGLPAEKR